MEPNLAPVRPTAVVLVPIFRRRYWAVTSLLVTAVLLMRSAGMNPASDCARSFLARAVRGLDPMSSLLRCSVARSSLPALLVSPDIGGRERGGRPPPPP